MNSATPPRQLGPQPTARAEDTSRLGPWIIREAPEVSTGIRLGAERDGPRRPVRSEIGADRVSRVPFASTGNA